MPDIRITLRILDNLSVSVQFLFRAHSISRKAFYLPRGVADKAVVDCNLPIRFYLPRCAPSFLSLSISPSLCLLAALLVHLLERDQSSVPIYLHPPRRSTSIRLKIPGVGPSRCVLGGTGDTSLLGNCSQSDLGVCRLVNMYREVSSCADGTVARLQPSAAHSWDEICTD